MSDLEDYESDIDEQDIDSDKDDKDDKDKKSLTSKKLVQSKIADSSGEEDEVDSEPDDILDEIDSELAEDEDEESEATFSQTINPIIGSELSPINSDVESDDDDDLQKFDSNNTLEYINNYHPECMVANSDEVEALSKIVRINGNIVDKNHMTNPILTKYEKTKILGQRTKQLNSGCAPYISVPNNIIDNYLIAQLELKAKKIPIIIRRPISNKRSEYWKLEDLEQLY